MNQIPAETLQRLIDLAHAAMEKRQGYPDEFAVIQSRISNRPGQFAVLRAKDLAAIQQLGNPWWKEPTPQPPTIVERVQQFIDAELQRYNDAVYEFEAHGDDESYECGMCIGARAALLEVRKMLGARS